MTTAQLGQMRDFLSIFNKISETCFQNCIDTLADRSLSEAEITCTDRCVAKYLGNNRAVMKTFVEVQPKIVERKIEEMNKMMETAQKEQEKGVEAA